VSLHRRHAGAPSSRESSGQAGVSQVDGERPAGTAAPLQPQARP
jgi:hypothetical protein